MKAWSRKIQQGILPVTSISFSGHLSDEWSTTKKSSIFLGMMAITVTTKLMGIHLLSIVIYKDLAWLRKRIRYFVGFDDFTNGFCMNCALISLSRSSGSTVNFFCRRSKTSIKRARVCFLSYLRLVSFDQSFMQRPKILLFPAFCWRTGVCERD